MRLICNADSAAPPAILWTLKYFIYFKGAVRENLFIFVWQTVNIIKSGSSGPTEEGVNQRSVLMMIILVYWAVKTQAPPTALIKKMIYISRYEVSSIKNAYLAIEYEGIKLQKCLIARKKRINVVVRFQFSEFGWLENSTFHRQLKTQKKWTCRRRTFA